MPDDSGLRAEDLVFRAGLSTRHAADDDGLPAVTRLAAYGVIVRDGRMLLCRVAPGNLGEGLWMLPGGKAAPISLGLVGLVPVQLIRLGREHAHAIGEAWGMALSIEPEGGSPTGAPTGPVIFRGQCVKIM